MTTRHQDRATSCTIIARSALPRASNHSNLSQWLVHEITHFSKVTTCCLQSLQRKWCPLELQTLLEKRNELGWSQAQVATHLGISLVWYGKIERGLVVPSQRLAKVISDFVSLDPTVLRSPQHGEASYIASRYARFSFDLERIRQEVLPPGVTETGRSARRRKLVRTGESAASELLPRSVGAGLAIDIEHLLCDADMHARLGISTLRFDRTDDGPAVVCTTDEAGLAHLDLRADIWEARPTPDARFVLAGAIGFATLTERPEVLAGTPYPDATSGRSRSDYWTWQAAMVAAGFIMPTAGIRAFLSSYGETHDVITAAELGRHFQAPDLLAAQRMTEVLVELCR